jgi:3-deoxy-D-manno-octulosonate 8-phosphate phosphatase (KDO 8-P phosphatase)
MHDELTERFRRVKMLAMDVDGVLSSPQIVLAGNPDLDKLFEVKQFCVHDGSANWAGKVAGLIQVVISGRDCPALRHRLQRMHIDAAYLGDLNKLHALAQLKEAFEVSDEEIAYVGDDFLDLPVMERVGLPIAVADATVEMKKVAAYITEKRGGEGAIEEVVRLILQAQGKWTWAVRETVKNAYAEPDLLAAAGGIRAVG